MPQDSCQRRIEDCDILMSFSSNWLNAISHSRAKMADFKPHTSVESCISWSKYISSIWNYEWITHMPWNFFFLFYWRNHYNEMIKKNKKKTIVHNMLEMEITYLDHTLSSEKPRNWYSCYIMNWGCLFTGSSNIFPMGMETSLCNRLLWTSGEENSLAVSRERISHWNGSIWHYSKAQVKSSIKR